MTYLLSDTSASHLQTVNSLIDEMQKLSFPKEVQEEAQTAKDLLLKLSE